MNSAVQDVHEVAKVLDQYGPVITILSIFLVIFIILIVFFIKQQAKSSAQLRNDNQKFIQNLISTNQKMMWSIKEEPKNEEKNKQDLMAEYMKISGSLKDNCKDYLDKTTADRMAIYLFHNGTHTAHGFPFFKFSCICEYISKGSLSRMKDHYDFPINLMGEMVKVLMDQKEYSEFSADQRTGTCVDPMIYKLLTSESNGFIVCAIFDSCNNIMGFILSEFNRSSLTECNLEYRKSIIIDMAKCVAPVLEFSHFTTTYKGGSIE